MSLKEELGKLECKETEEDGEEARLNAIEADIYRLYRRISMIVDYIDQVIPEASRQEPKKESRKAEGLGKEVGDV